jgi:reactive intermediate/imine deaminase
MEHRTRREFVTAAGAAAVLGGAAGANAAAQTQPSQEGKTGKQIIPGSPYPTFSRAVRLDRLVFVAGVVGQKPGTRDLVGGEFEAEARQALENLKASVEASGSVMANVLKCTVYITQAADFAAFNKVYVKLFPSDPPARSSVVVKELVVPGARLEIDCVTYVD